MVPFSGCARYSSGGLEAGELLRRVVRHWLYAARSPKPVFASWLEMKANKGGWAAAALLPCRECGLRVSPVPCFRQLFWGIWIWLQPHRGSLKSLESLIRYDFTLIKARSGRGFAKPLLVVLGLVSSPTQDRGSALLPPGWF